jgi:hypothetical protein
MKWNTSSGVCSKCGAIGRVSPSFGKLICDKCKDNRPNKGKGNSGLKESTQSIMVFEDGLILERCPKSDETFGRLFFAHYPGSKGIPGRSLCYLVKYHSNIAGIIGFNSPPRNYGVFNAYFGKGNENRFVLNNVFRLVDNEKNLATRVMKIARNRIRKEYKEKYGEELIGIATFVEPPRTGALYKADNWDYIGETAGKRMKRDKDTWGKVFSEGTVKHIFGYKYG